MKNYEFSRKLSRFFIEPKHAFRECLIERRTITVPYYYSMLQIAYDIAQTR